MPIYVICQRYPGEDKLFSGAVASGAEKGRFTAQPISDSQGSPTGLVKC